MVLGKTAKMRLSAHSSRKWYIGREESSETDEQHHLGILRTVFTSTIHRTSERCTAARSSFFALNSIGSMFGCLHPLTSYRLYQTLCIPILLYGAEIWTLSKVELNMLEQIHRNILHTIQGLPTCCHHHPIITFHLWIANSIQVGQQAGAKLEYRKPSICLKQVSKC